MTKNNIAEELRDERRETPKGQLTMQFSNLSSYVLDQSEPSLVEVLYFWPKSEQSSCLKKNSAKLASFIMVHFRVLEY